MMHSASSILIVTLLVVGVNAGGPSTNTRHYGGVQRPGHGQVGFGHSGQVGGQFGAAGGRPVNHGQVGVEQFGVGGGRPSLVGQFGGVPQGVSPPLITSLTRPDCKFFKRDQYGKYICDVDQKPFECPLVRPYCPKFGVPIGPQKCYNDNDCYGNDKCCRDACFNHLICKGAH